MANTQTGKESAVAAAVEALHKGMIAADMTALENLATAELSYGHAGGRLETRAEFIASVMSGKVAFSAIDVSRQTISVVDKVAIARYGFVGTRRTAPGEPVKKLSVEMLTVWLEQPDKQWKLTARQALKL